jgi:hypothetical protein
MTDACFAWTWRACALAWRPWWRAWWFAAAAIPGMASASIDDEQAVSTIRFISNLLDRLFDGPLWVTVL